MRAAPFQSTLSLGPWMRKSCHIAELSSNRILAYRSEGVEQNLSRGFIVAIMPPCNTKDNMLSINEPCHPQQFTIR